jgi:hypothetical protein
LATEKWIAGSGQGLTWGGLFGTEINTTIANGNAIKSSVAVTNGTALDIFMDISYLAGGTATTAAPNYLGFYLLPLGQDGSTYGDGNWASSTAVSVTNPLPGQNWVGNMTFFAAASTTIAGVITRIILPPGSFKALLYNGSGASLFNGTNTCKYRTYNRSIA